TRLILYILWKGVVRKAIRMMVEMVGRERGRERYKNQYDEPRGTGFRDRMMTEASNKMRSCPTVHAGDDQQDSCWQREPPASKNSRTYRTLASARSDRRDIIVSLCPSATILSRSSFFVCTPRSSQETHEPFAVAAGGAVGGGRRRVRPGWSPNT